MLTAYGGEEVMSKAREAKLDGFLVKPVTPSNLLDSIMGAFGKGTNKFAPSAVKSGSQVDIAENIKGSDILLVEDNEINQEVALEVLEQAGLSVTVANNGQEAIDALATKNIDCVLMDLQMPVMDGFEATKHIRNNSKHKTLPIIAMTANAMSGDKEKCLDAGMNDHVSKPIDTKQLFTALNRWTKPGKRKTKIAKKPKKTGKKAAEESFPDLPGFDVSKGLEILGGNKELYRTLLLKLYEDFSGSAQKIKSLLDKNDEENAEILAHTVKGVGSNLGALKLSKLAADLENAFRTKSKGDYKKMLAAFEKELDLVSNGLESNGFGTQKSDT